MLKESNPFSGSHFSAKILLLSSFLFGNMIEKALAERVKQIFDEYDNFKKGSERFLEEVQACRQRYREFRD